MVHGRGCFEKITFNHKGIHNNKIKERELQSLANMVKSSILGMSTLESGADICVEVWFQKMEGRHGR